MGVVESTVFNTRYLVVSSTRLGSADGAGMCQAFEHSFSFIEKQFGQMPKSGIPDLFVTKSLTY